MSNPLRKVSAEVAYYVELRKTLEEQGYSDDPQMLLDTLEGETDLNGALLLLADHVQSLTAQAKGIDSRIADLSDRKARVTKSAETLRNIILQAMDTASVPKIAGDCITLSVRKLSGQMTVTDESAIPSAYWRQPPPVLDKAALKEALKGGDEVPGAEIGNGGISLTMRVK